MGIRQVAQAAREAMGKKRFRAIIFNVGYDEA
jgi:hypothetical protein